MEILLPRELVIGADSFIGRRLKQLTGAEGTSRRGNSEHHLDCHFMDVRYLPSADIVYLCAAANGQKICEGNALAYRVNVDATIRLAKHYQGKAFFVWISSSTVEWANSAYARHKALTETALRMMPGVGIVRAGRVLKSNVDDLCRTLMEVGRNRIEDVTIWGSEEPYEK